MKKLMFKTAILTVLLNACLVQLFAFDETLNLANGKTATARDSRDFDGYGTNPSFATDNSMTTHWCAQWDGAGNGSWIYVDLANYYMINKVIIDWRDNRWPGGAWKLQVATNMPDGSGSSNWVDVYTGNAGSDVTNGTGIYSFTPTAGRYVRMLGASQSNGYGYNIYEMKVYANDDALPQGAASGMLISPSTKTLMVGQQFQFQSDLVATNGIPMSATFTPSWSVQESSGATIASSTGIFKATQTGTFTINCNTSYESNPFNTSATVTVIPFDITQNVALNKVATTSGETASFGNDDNINTRWRSNNANQQEWWQVDLGTDYAVNNVKVKMNGDAGARNATYDILVSLTGLEGSWQTLVTNAQIPAGSGTELNNHTFTSTPARYVKYQGLTKGGWDHNFAEFEVFATGFYSASASSEFTSVQFSNASVIQNEEVALTIVTNDQESNPYTNATITGVQVTTGSAAGVSLVQRNGVWYATGIVEGTYTLTATGVDNSNGSLVKTGTATLAVTEARRVVTINLTTPFAITKYPTNRAIDLTLSCVDQYGAAISPTIVWDIQGTAGGSVSNNKYTPINKGTGTIKATVNTSAGLVESQSRTFDIITTGTNVALNKTVTSISTATTSGANAVDNNIGSQWIVPDPGSRTYDAWIVIDLQAEYHIELVEVIWEGAFSKTFTVDYSANGSDFTTKYSHTNPDGVETKVNKFYSNPSAARYVRIFSTQAGTQYGTKLLEVYVHGKPTTITLDNDNTLSTSDFTSEQLQNTDLIINSGTLTIDINSTIKSLSINPGAKLTLNASKTLASQSITLKSDATGTATFVDKNSDNLQAITATVEQYVTNGRNWYMSIPLATAASSVLNKGTSVVYYKESTGEWLAPESSTLKKLQGYIQTATTTPLTGETGTVAFTGELNTGTHSINTLTRTAGKTGFNLVGNPYPSYLDWNLVTKTNVSNTLWYRTKVGDVYTFYTYIANEGAGIGVPASVTNNIPPMQAFWIRVLNEGTGSIAVDNTMRSHKDLTGNIMKAPRQDNQKLIRLQVSNGVNTDEAVIYFNEKASNAFDSYDAQKRSNENAAIPEIFTQIGSEKLVINGMNDITYDTEIPIGFTTGTANNFSLTTTEFMNFDADTKIILIDKLNPDVQIDLSQGAVYNFSSQAIAPTTDRFSLVFKAPGMTTNFKNALKHKAQVTVNQHNQLIIFGQEKCNYAIYNAVGQKMTNGTTISDKTIINYILKAGIYIVEVSENGQNYTSTVIIK